MQLSVAAGLFSFLPSSHSKSNANGKLLIIGGAEDRQNECIILKKFIELSGGNQAKLRFILAASSEPSSVWSSYSNVFKNLGATNVEPIALLSREDAYNPNVDGREMISNYDEIETQEKLELLGVKMHLLPSESSFLVHDNRVEEKVPNHF